MDKIEVEEASSVKMLGYALLPVIGYMLYLLCCALHNQYSLIAFYEKQGIRVFPWAKRPLIGNLPEHLAYQKVRMTSETVPVSFQWLLSNISKFEGKTQKAKSESSPTTPYSPITLMYVFGLLNFFVSDPDILGDSQKEKNILDKNSYLKKDVFDSRLGDNVQSNPRSLEHT